MSLQLHSLRTFGTAFAALLMVAAVLVAPPPAEGATGGGGALTSAGTSSGNEFWLAFQHNYANYFEPEDGSDPVDLELFVAGAAAGSGTLSVPGLGFTEGFTVTPGEVTTVEVPLEAILTATDGTEDLGVHVTADTDLSVYGLNQAPLSTDAFLGLPVSALGTEYAVLAWPTDDPGTETGPRTQLAVVGIEDDTTVSIVPSATTGARQAGVSYEVTLDTGEAYQLQGTEDDVDLTGSLITADKPVAAFAGHEAANVPEGVDYSDHIAQQLLPTSTWGSSFVTVPFIDRAADTFRIIAATDGTEVAVGDSVVATLDRGEFHETSLADPAHITATHPVAVAQYMHSSTDDRSDADRFGDPAVVPVPPAEQFLAEYTVTTPAEGFADHAINLVVPDPAVGEVAIDGAAVPASEYTSIGDSGFSGAQVPVAAGSKVLSGPLPFGATVYGTNLDDSYAYPGGLSLSPVANVDSVSIDPGTATGTIEAEHCAVATVLDDGAAPLTGVRVDFEVSGANSASGFVFTDPSGQAEFCYTGTEVGEDTITAVVGPHSADATQSWELPPPVQSFWMFGPLRIVEDSGEVVDVREDLIDAVSDNLGPPITLFDDVVIREAPDLAPVLVSETGEVRDDVDIVAGVVDGPDTPGGGAIIVAARPSPGGGVSSSAGRHAIRPGDSVRVSMDPLGDRVTSGTPVVASPTYGEVPPDPADPAEGADPLQVLADGFAEDPDTGEIRANMAGAEDEDGNLVAAPTAGMTGAVSQGHDGSLHADLPAIDRMLAHFSRGEVDTTGDPVESVASIIETFFITYLAVVELTEYLQHMTDGGTPSGFVSPFAFSWGDPHLRTFDLYDYDFQGVGEFVAARTDGLEVQLRMVPSDARPDAQRLVSSSRLVAIGVGDDTVIVRGGVDTPVLVNGAGVTREELGEGIELDAGTVALDERAWLEIDTDDGHHVYLNCPTLCSSLDVYVTPAERGDGAWEGLFGTNDGDSSNDLQTREGEVLEQPVSFDDLYGPFAESWRVSDEESLFVYGPGEDAETFHDRSYPSEMVTVDTLSDEVRAPAEALCREAGLGEDATTFEGCVLDFALTGDVCYVRSAQTRLSRDFTASPERVSGTNRVETSVQLSRQFSSADTALVARSDDYADALAAAPLAVQLEAPILLTPSGGVETVVLNEIRRLGADRVVLLGGEAALSQDVEDELRASGVDVDRYAGDNRFDTAAQVAADLDGEPTRAFVVEGANPDPNRGWPDAVAVSALAAYLGEPILMTTADALPADTGQAVRSQGYDEITIVGGPMAVSQAVESELAGMASVDRVSGEDRFATSAALGDAALAAGMGTSSVWLATARNWPDSLSAAPVVASTAPTVAVDGGVLLLVDGADFDRSAASRQWLEANAASLSTVTAVGGAAVITPEVLAQAREAIEED